MQTMFKSFDDYKKVLKEILISEERLQARIKELGGEISKDYADKELLLICIFLEQTFIMLMT